jgi:hypothetical protein
MITQKTWTELLGPITDADLVLGKEFLRRVDDDHYKVMWRFEDETVAFECFHQWKRGK